jgi:hypothetical protein
MTIATKHLEKLPEDWEHKFLDMYDHGCSDWEIMREYGIKPRAWKIMYSALGESQFREVVEFGNVLSRAWWEKQGRTKLNTRGFNTRLYDIQMQNRFGWAKKAETTETEAGVTEADQESLDRRLAELRDKAQVSGDAET